MYRSVKEERDMYVTTDNRYGSVEISMEVLGNLIGNAATS